MGSVRTYTHSSHTTFKLVARASTACSLVHTLENTTLPGSSGAANGHTPEAKYAPYTLVRSRRGLPHRVTTECIRSI